MVEDVNEWCNMPAKVFCGFIETDFALHLAPSLGAGTGIAEGDKQGNNTGSKDLAGESMSITLYCGVLKFQG